MDLKAFFFFIIFSLVAVSNAAAQDCNSNGVYCVSCTSYQLCANSLPIGGPTACPSGMFCDEDSPSYCSSSSSGCPDFFVISTPPPTESEPPTETTTPATETTTPATETTIPATETTIPATETTTPATETTTPATETTTPVTETTTMPGETTLAPFECTAEGVYAHETNCKYYYRCTATLVKYLYSCPGNSYFNEVTSKCSTVLSPKCQTQVGSTTTTTTTSTTPSTTSTSTTTTTPSTTTSTTTTTTTTPSTSTSSTTPAPFQCTSEGVFPHPTDCKKYYRCTASLVKYEYSCTSNMYFNEVTLKCSTTLTAKCAAQVGGTTKDLKAAILGRSGGFPRHPPSASIKNNEDSNDDDDDDDDDAEEPPEAWNGLRSWSLWSPWAYPRFINNYRRH